jgi:hypothetical protein
VFLSTNPFLKAAEQASVKEGAITILLLDHRPIDNHLINSRRVTQKLVYFLDFDVYLGSSQAPPSQAMKLQSRKVVASCLLRTPRGGQSLGAALSHSNHMDLGHVLVRAGR